MTLGSDTYTPRTIPLRSYIPVALLVFFGTLLSLTVFLSIGNQEAERKRLEFEKNAGFMADALTVQLSDYLGAIHFLGDFFYNSETVSRKEFRQFTRGALHRFPEIISVAWCPYIQHKDRRTFEKEAGFPIVELADAYTLKRARTKEDYLPLAYIEPVSGNRNALGFDNSSESIRRKAALQAYYSGNITATARIDLVQSQGRHPGILMMLPVFSKTPKKETPGARLENLDGFVIGAFVLEDMIRNTLSAFKDQGLCLVLYDTSAGPAADLIGSFPSQNACLEDRPGVMTLTRHMDFASREWKIRIMPEPHSVYGRASWYPVGILAASLCFTCMVAFHMYQKMTAGFENEWRMKSEIQINEQLELEIARREQEEARLRMTQQSLEREIKERISLEKQRDKSILELRKTLAEMRNLQGILPLCSYCKKIKDSTGTWEPVDVYIHKHSQADVSHGICPECMRKHYPDEFREIYG